MRGVRKHQKKWTRLIQTRIRPPLGSCTDAKKASYSFLEYNLLTYGKLIIPSRVTVWIM